VEPWPSGSIGFDVYGTCGLPALGLAGDTYPKLLHLFHSPALSVDRLTECWIRLTQRLFTPLRVGERLVLVADGVKIPKEV